MQTLSKGARQRRVHPVSCFSSRARSVFGRFFAGRGLPSSHCAGCVRRGSQAAQDPGEAVPVAASTVPPRRAIYMFVLPTVARLDERRHPRSAPRPLRHSGFLGALEPGRSRSSRSPVCGFLIIYLLRNKGSARMDARWRGILGVADRTGAREDPRHRRVRGVRAPHRPPARRTCACARGGPAPFGMVVSPRVHEVHGLCVNVCPKEALYRLGTPPSRKGSPGPSASLSRSTSRGPRSLAMGAVFVVSIVVLAGLYDRVPFLPRARAFRDRRVSAPHARADGLRSEPARLSRHSCGRGAKVTGARRDLRRCVLLWAVFSSTPASRSGDLRGRGSVRRGGQRGIASRNGLAAFASPMGRIEAGIADAH